jgi:hypothetical protein
MCNRIRWAFLGFCVFWVSLGPGILQPARGAEIITGQYGSVTAVDDTLFLSDGYASGSYPISVGAAGFSSLTVTLSGPIETTFSLTGLYDTANNPLPDATFDIYNPTFNDPLYTVLTMNLSPKSGVSWPSELLPLAEFADTTVTFEFSDIALDPSGLGWVPGPDAAVKITMSTGEQPPGDGGKRVPTGPAPVPAPDSLVLALAGITLLLCAGWYYRRGHAVRPAG